MKKACRIPVALLAACCLLFALGAYAAEEAPAGPGPDPRFKRMYDLGTVETVVGEVTMVNKISHRRGPGYGVHLVLKTDTEEIPVRLGPSRFLDRQEVKIGQNDKIQVKGSRVTYHGGKQAIIAAEVKKGTALLKLRDENGVPAWSRRKDVREKTEQ